MPLETIYTTSAPGLVSVGTNWVGGVKPPAGSRVKLAHAMTIDEDVTWGDNPPERPLTVATVNVTGGGASGGSLAAGTYRVSYTNIDGSGRESAIAPSAATFTVASGNIPRLTLPALPTGVVSRRIYLSNTGSPTSEKRLYATGVTTTTYDLALGTWLDASLAAVAYASADPEPQGYGLVILDACPLTIRARLNLRGDVWQGNSLITLDRGYSGVGVRFDSTGASSPSTTGRGWYMGRANTRTDTRWTTTGTANLVTIDSVTTGGAQPGFFAEYTPDGVIGSYVDTTFWQISGVQFTDLGTTARDAISMRPSASAVDYVFEDCTFTRCSAVRWQSNIPAASSLSYRRNQHLQSIARVNAGTGNVNIVRFAVSSTKNAGKTRVIEHCSFDNKVYLRGGAVQYLNNFFWLGWDHASDAVAWEDFSGFVRKTVNSQQATNGQMRNTYFLVDPASTRQQIATGVFVGTVTGGSNSTTSGTLVDSARSWTTGPAQWFNPPSAVYFVRKIAALDGAIEERRIINNNSNTLTTEPPWDVLPVAGDTYEIWSDLYNPHGINMVSVSGGVYDYTGNVGQFYGFDPDGDMFINYPVSATYNVRDNVMTLNRGRADMSGCLVTMFNTTHSGVRLYVEHNTCPVGTQSLVQVDEGGSNQPAGTLASCKSNLSYGVRPTSWYSGGLNGFLITNSDNVASGPAWDIIDPANISHNWQYLSSLGGLAGNGVNLILSSSAPAPLGTSDPRLLDDTRNVLTWGERVRETNGSLPAALQILSDDPTLIPSMLAWVRGGFAPRTLGLKDAGHDGGTVGAVPFAGNPTPFGRAFML